MASGMRFGWAVRWLVCVVWLASCGASQDPSLSALVPSAGSLTPAFAPDVTRYEVTVGLATDALALSPTVAMPSAGSITVDGVGVASGQRSAERTLALGDTVFSIVVTASGGATRTYTVTAHRALRALQAMQQAYVKASNTSRGDDFGYSVALSGDTLAVGANVENSGATGINGNQADRSARSAGAVYVFMRTGATWLQQAYLKASNAHANAYFGNSVALSGDTLAVGSPTEGSNGTGIAGDQTNHDSASGAVYVFTRTGTVWTQQAYVKASNAGRDDAFGTSVALSGETLAVGAPGEAGNATGTDGIQADDSVRQSGAAYVFTRTNAVWTQQAYVKASNTGASDSFGNSIALDGDTLAVGALFEDSGATGIDGVQADESAMDSGAVYVFARTGTHWTQQAYVKAGNTGSRDGFGVGIAVAGDTLVVGAPYEDGGATGIDGAQGDDSAMDSGAVYVFTRAGAHWAQQAYVKASNAGANDSFGLSVAVSGDTLAVGARWEDGSATGIDGAQHDDRAMDSGAVYLFGRTGATWTQRAYVKASNSGAGDDFGWSIALSGDTLAVAADYEASVATGVDGDQGDNTAGGAGAVYVFTLAH